MNCEKPVVPSDAENRRGPDLRAESSRENREIITAELGFLQELADLLGAR